MKHSFENFICDPGYGQLHFLKYLLYLDDSKGELLCIFIVILFKFSLNIWFV